MKNLQKGFIVPLLLVIIAVLVIGGGVYIYKNKKTESPVVVDIETQQSNQTIINELVADWKKIGPNILPGFPAVSQAFYGYPDIIQFIGNNRVVISYQDDFNPLFAVLSYDANKKQFSYLDGLRSSPFKVSETLWNTWKNKYGDVSFTPQTYQFSSTRTGDVVYSSDWKLITKNPFISGNSQVNTQTPTPTPTQPISPTPSKPYSPPVVKSNDSVDTFVKNANFPKSSGVNIFINTPTQNLQVFSVSYGEPQDCPSGCFFSNATGIKYGNKIGWISVNDYDQIYDQINVSKLIMYDFGASDTYLYTDEFSQALKSKNDWVYQNAFLPKLAKDKDVPRNVLLKIANGLSSYIQPSLANNLLENSAVKNDREILTIIANLPVFSGDAYSEVRAKAQALLK